MVRAKKLANRINTVGELFFRLSLAWLSRILQTNDLI